MERTNIQSRCRSSCFNRVRQAGDDLEKIHDIIKQIQILIIRLKDKQNRLEDKLEKLINEDKSKTESVC